MIRGLIFDFDGLIVDSETPDYEAWRDLCAEHGYVLPFELWAGGIGRGATTMSHSPLDLLEQHVGRPLERESLKRRKRERYLTMVAAEPLRAGVEEYISEARRLGLRLGVASSSSDGWVSGNLARLGLLDSFDCLRCGGDVARAKPFPDVYLSTLECLGLRPEEAIALEDSPNGAAAALAAGLVCVVVPNSMTRALTFPDGCLLLASLDEMPLAQLLERAAGVH
jgi:HAD superfamily hydrolase (TIGR01509 family)